MNSDERLAKNKIAESCCALLSGEVDLVYECRKIVALRNRYGLAHDPLLLPFVGVVSETDDYPDIDGFSNFNIEALRRIKGEVQKYVLVARDPIFAACRKIIEAYSID